jgi:outer membrane protein assembly factor BamB
MRRRLAFVTLLVLTLVATIAAAPVAASSRFPARINLPNGWQPEGITAGRGTTVYAGSLANGAIRKVDVRTGASSTLVAGVAGRVAVGVEYDKRNNRLWVAGGPTGVVRVYNASTGALLQTYAFPGSGFLNDLVVTRRAVYVTDSSAGNVKVVPLGPGGSLPAPSAATTLPLTGFPVVAGQFNANGIVAIGGWLIVVNSFTGELFRVNPQTGVSREIDLGGASVSSGDGLELRGSTIYVVRNFLNQVAVFKLRDQFLSARAIGTITSPGLDVPTTVAFQAGRLWAVNARFSTPPTPNTEYWITRLPARP